MITKEYPHPFFKVVIDYDETKPETDYEKELVKRYLDWLDKLQQKKELIKDLRNRCFQEQLMEDDSMAGVDELIKRYALLLERAEEFRDGKNDDRDEFAALTRDRTAENERYLQHYAGVVDEIRELSILNEKDFEILFNWFEEEEYEKDYELLNDYEQELYKNFDDYSLDLITYDKSIDTMKGPWGKVSMEWKELYDIKQKTVEFQANHNKKLEEVNNAVRELEDIMEELSEGKFRNKEVDITETDAVCIQFRFLEEEMFISPDAGYNELGIQFRVDYDLEKPGEDLWIFNMDNYVHVPHEAFFQVRSSFIIPMNKKEMLRRDVLLHLIDQGFKNAFECADEFYKKEKKKFNWLQYKMPGESRDFLIQNLTERTEGFDDTEEEEKGYYNQSFIFEGTILERGTILILNEVLYNNPAFNWELNQQAFGQIIPMPVYVTLRCKVQESSKEPQAVNLAKLLAFMLCVECASQLLTGDHLPTLEPGLNEKKFDENVRRAYLKEAQNFIKEALDQMKESGTHFGDMEVDYRDWNDIIK